MAIADYLRKLIELKNQLVANLQSMGVTADESEKLNTLVPKVLDIEIGIDTTDATATAEDIAAGKTACAKGEKLTGTLVQSVEWAKTNGTVFTRSLKKVIIPNSFTSIGDNAFSNNTYLESVIIPDSVTSIGNRVFSGCSSLAHIYYTGTQTQWNAISKGTDWKYLMGKDVSGGTVIHYNYVP